MTDDIEQKMRKCAFKDHDVRLGCVIMEDLENATDIVDEQSPAVLEAIIAHINELEEANIRSWRHAIRVAVREYVANAIRKAKEQQRSR